MNLAVYIPLAGSLCNIFFALFVFAQAPKALANRVYLLLGTSIAIWNIGSYKLFVVTNADEALIWARVVFIGVIFAIAAFVHLSLIIAEYRARWIGALYAFEVLLGIIDCTPYFISGVIPLGASGWYGQAGPAFHLLNVPYALSFVSVTILWRKRKRLPPSQRFRLGSIIGAQILIFALGLNDLLPIVHVYYYPIIHVPVYPYGSLAAVFYGMIVAHSVLHHQLLDMHVTLSRYAAHFIRFAFIFFAATGLLLVMQLATGLFDGRTFLAAMGVFLITSALTATFFPRLFGRGGIETWERRILGDRFEYQDQARNFIANMTWQNDLSQLLDELDEVLTKAFRFTSYQIILRDETTRAFTLFRAFPEEPQRQLPELKAQSAVFQYFEWGKGEYLSLRETGFRTSPSLLERQAREQVAQFGSALCFALSSQSEPFGLLLVGPKLNSAPVTATDINLLVTAGENDGPHGQSNPPQNANSSGSGTRFAWPHVPRHGP